ncbi:MAG: hypothetical protein ACYDCQ_10265 [Dehalococcoidia bacterium]
MFRRRTSEPQSPQRGPGGGKIRNRAPERRGRRRLGVADYATLSVIGAVIVFVLEYWIVHAQPFVAILYAAVVAVVSVGFNYWMEQRRWRNAPPPPKRRR